MQGARLAGRHEILTHHLYLRPPERRFSKWQQVLLTNTAGPFSLVPHIEERLHLLPDCACGPARGCGPVHSRHAVGQAGCGRRCSGRRDAKLAL